MNEDWRTAIDIEGFLFADLKTKLMCSQGKNWVHTKVAE